MVRSPWRQSGWSPVCRKGFYGVKDLWNRWVLSLEWERESNGWCDGGDRWTRLTEWSRKIIPKTGWRIMERAIWDFERGRWGRTSDSGEGWRTSATRRLNRDQVMVLWRYAGWAVERVLHVRERILYSIRSLTFSQWRDMRIGVIWENLGALTTARARKFWVCWSLDSWGDYNISLMSCSNRVWSEWQRWQLCWLFWYQGMGGYNGVDECESCRGLA